MLWEMPAYRSRRIVCGGFNRSCVRIISHNVWLTKIVYRQPKVCKMAEAKRLRDRSARCTRLVKEMTDPTMIANLKALALESDEAAAVLEAAKRLALTKP
jgi:hypothetical protein